MSAGLATPLRTQRSVAARRWTTQCKAQAPVKHTLIRMDAPTRPWCKKLDKRSGWYDWFFAKLLHAASGAYNKLLHNRKQVLFSIISQGTGVNKLLEIGLGTGPNMRYYSANKVCTCNVNLQTQYTPKCMRRGIIVQLVLVSVRCLLATSPLEVPPHQPVCL